MIRRRCCEPGRRWTFPLDALAPAEAARLVVATPVIQFRHPLMRAAIYQGASLADRRRVHRALADVLDAEGDADRRAWHAAEAVLGPDEAVAAQLERSAERARRRSGIAAESAYLQRAADLTPAPRDRVRLLLDAARAAQIAGSWTQAEALLTRAEPLLEDARQSADLLRLRAALHPDLGSPAGAVEMMLDAARALEPLDVRAARDVLLELLHTCLLTDPVGGSVTAYDIARAIRDGPRPADGGDELTELVLDAFATRLVGDYREAVPRLRAVVAALASGPEPDGRLEWTGFANVAAAEVWDEDARRTILEHTARRQREQGALHPLRLTLISLGSALIGAGRLKDAEACYHESTELTLAIGRDPRIARRMNSELLAWQGRDEEMRAAVQSAVDEGCRRRLRQTGVQRDASDHRALSWARATMRLRARRPGAATRMTFLCSATGRYRTSWRPQPASATTTSQHPHWNDSKNARRPRPTRGDLVCWHAHERCSPTTSTPNSASGKPSACSNAPR